MSGHDSTPGFDAFLWDLGEEVMRAPTQSELEGRVCEGLASHDGFDGAWISDSAPEGTPRTIAGVDRAEIDRIRTGLEDAGIEPPWRRAAADLDAIHRADLETRSEADQTVRSVALHHQRINYGVLTVIGRGTGPPDRGDGIDGLGTFGQLVGLALATGELQTHGEIFRQAIEQAEPALAILDQAGTVEYVNAGFESVFGYSKSDAIDSSLQAIVSGIPETIIEDVTMDRPWQEEVVCQGKRGRQIYVNVSVAAVPVEGGTRSKYVVAATDVTPIRDREERLQVLNRVLRHNLRNDLNAIQWYLRMATETVDEAAGELLDVASETTDDLLATAETSRNMQATLSRAERRPLDLVAVIDAVTARVSEEYPDHEVRVSAPDSIEVLASDGLEAALWELLENAFLHGADPVAIEVTSVSEGVEVAVSDRGPGIPDHELAVIEAGEETPLEHGSGLGLWFVYWVVRASRGDLSFETDGGTTVRITLLPS